MQDKSSKGGRWASYRPSKVLYFWSMVGAVVLTILVGFTWGGWVTGGTAATMAQNAATKAHNQLAAAVCVGRFMQSPKARTVLASIKGQDWYSRGGIVEKGGWATMPGEKSASSDVADACAQKLASMKLPPAQNVAANATKQASAAATQTTAKATTVQ